jgi:predicted nucleotidyltransferase
LRSAKLPYNAALVKNIKLGAITMRLTPQTIAAITQAAQAVLGADAQVWLFGSRVDDGARGGDIDLYVQTNQVLSNRVSAACQISAQIQQKIGLQKIDVVLKDANTPAAPIHQVAQEQGVRLC